MSLPLANQKKEIVDGHEGLAASHVDLHIGNDLNMEVEEDEENEDVNREVEEEDEEAEDVDFNPFLRADTSEASSSLSSEDEGLCDTAERSIDRSANGKDVSACASSIPIDETQNAQQHSDFGDCSGNHDANCLTKEETSQKPMVEAEDEDSICRRTRARQSLVNYTLEELETFLQESDDEGDLPNIDDEEEYRKFLAAVLLGGGDEGKTGQEEGDVDEDEDDDADFELEIEEALESDADEDVDWDKRQDKKTDRDAHMRETRQKNCLKESSKDKKYLLEQAKKPLRPILPYKPHAKTSPLLPHGWQPLFPKSSSLPAANATNGFTAHQLGQLYSLIHEHAQLLIQVFSISVLDPSKQQVSNVVQKMILEMNGRREEALSQRKLPYPRYCFQPPNLFSSMQSDFHQTADCPHWTPFLQTDSVLSVLDVAPLRLVKSYIADVSDIVLRFRQQYIQDVPDENLSTKVPLFPLPMLSSPTDTSENIFGRNTTMSSNRHSTLPLSPGHVQPKKSLATLIVETTKKQSVAPVPKDIAKSTQRFYPLFNSALFPHKPPAPAIASRVLFTDAEDGLLAMGIMDYSNDWAAIQQHYLPCKSTHQIFVRQKNRSSSKAPENPIKAVRRMKTSPLTAHEQTLISEGLKIFKHDWSLVWKFFLPHRDPCLLPRQWRIANGTQISYKKSEASKEKRRAYEAKRRKLKSIAGCQMPLEEETNNGEDKSGDDVDVEDEAYVHEAFVEDSEKGSPKPLSYDNLPSTNRKEMQAVDMMPYYKGSYSIEHCDSVTNECLQSQQGMGHELLNPSLQDVDRTSHFPHIRCNTSMNSVSCFSKRSIVEHPYHKRTKKCARVVKLAPDLPPVNLPSSVRVISQSIFSVISQSTVKSYENISSCSKIQANAVSPQIPQLSRLGRSISTPGECLSKYSGIRHQQDEGFHASSFGAEENTSESDLRMHPLLFQGSEVQSSVNLSENRHTTSSTYNFFPGDPFQDGPNLVHQRPATSINRGTSHLEGASNLCTIDFHPLLQRDSALVPSVSHQSGDLRTMEGNCEKSYTPSEHILTVPRVGEDLVATSTASQRLYKQENNLDLSIHLSSIPDKEVAEGQQSGSSATPPSGYRMLKKGLYANMPFLSCSDNCPEALVKNKSAVKSLTCSQNDSLSSEVTPGNGDTCQHMIDLQDESVLGIVMEQEELSDSEEEIEHVEFECEEIDDSDEDELGCGQPTGIQKKDSAFFNLKKENTQYNDNLQPSQLGSLEGGSVGKGDDRTSTMQISQVSRHAKSSQLTAQQHNSAKQNRPCRSSANVPPSGPGRSSKKQSAESSKRQPSKAAKCKAVSSSKRPRKQ